MTHEKVVDRIKKLIELSVSTTFEHERETTAVEAVRLIHKHKVSLGESRAEPRPRARRHAEPAWESNTAGNWQPGTATANGRCAVCGGPYYKGNLVWIADGRGVIHIEWPDPPCAY